MVTAVKATVSTAPILISTVPSHLNTYPVVMVECHEGGLATVMVDKDYEFVVATWWPELGINWMWGHYVDDRKHAREIFDEVAAKNVRRR